MSWARMKIFCADIFPCPQDFMIGLDHHLIIVLSSSQACVRINPKHCGTDVTKSEFKFLKHCQWLGRNRFFSGRIVHFLFRS